MTLLPEQNPFDSLGIQLSDFEKMCRDGQFLKSAYLKACRQHHPDRDGGSSSRFKNCQQAYAYFRRESQNNQINLVQKLRNGESYSSIITSFQSRNNKQRNNNHQTPNYRHEYQNKSKPDTKFYYNKASFTGSFYPFGDPIDPALMRSRNQAMLAGLIFGSFAAFWVSKQFFAGRISSGNTWDSHSPTTADLDLLKKRKISRNN